LVAAVCGLLLTACSGGQDAMPGSGEGVRRDSASLWVAVTPTLDCLPLYVADRLGLFDQVGADVTLCVYTAHMDCDTALTNRYVDGSFTDLVRAERLKQAGVGLEYAVATNLTWQLLSSYSARIRQFKQLDDKMVAMTRYSATAMLADMAVDSARLEPERVFRIQVNDVTLRLQMLENGIIDALLLPEPQATQARNERAYTMFDTRTMDLRLGALAFRSDVMRDTLRRRQVERLLQTYDMACDSINTHGLAHFRDLIAATCRVEGATADSLSTDIRFDHAEAPRQADIDRALNWLKKQ